MESGCQGYNPLQGHLISKQASEILMEWCCMAVKEYRINPEKDVLTSCTDSGSDVKRALEDVLPTIHEWCVPHLTHLALADAFGSHVNPKKSQNSDMREFVSRCRKMVETVNKSKVLKSIFEGKVLTDFGHIIKLQNSPSHLWSAMENNFVHILCFWYQIRNSFIESQQEFPFSGDRPLILELCSVIHPVCYKQTTAQKTKELSLFQVYVLLMDAYFGVLHEEEPLNLYDPSLTSTLSSENSAKPADIDCLKPTSVKVARELDPRTKKVRNMLKEAMHTRLYMHYYPTQAYKRKNSGAA
jgi:hypothetical protein